MADRKNEEVAKEAYQIPIEDVTEATEETMGEAEATEIESGLGSDADEGLAAADASAAGAGASDVATPDAAPAAATEDAAGQDAAPDAAGEGAAPDAAGEGAAPDAAGEAAADEATPDAATSPDEAALEDDLIAEAEAIVEEASAAEQLADAQAKAQDWQDRYMRLHAEWDTYRRRTTEQRAEERQRATEKLMEELLPVLDDFERTVAYAAENGETGLLDGVKAVQAKLVEALTKGGLTVIDPAGEPYEALEAQAVQMVPDEEAFDETVKDVYQKGYKMGKKVLRPAMVTVTTGGPKRPKEEEADE